MANIDEGRAPEKGEGDGEADDSDKRTADSDFDDLIIEVDESELESARPHGSAGARANAAASMAARWILMSRLAETTATN